MLLSHKGKRIYIKGLRIDDDQAKVELKPEESFRSPVKEKT